jgi:hypothetical protein
MMNWKGLEKKRLWSYQLYSISAFAWTEWKELQRTPVRTGFVPAETQTKHFSYKSWVLTLPSPALCDAIVCRRSLPHLGGTCCLRIISWRCKQQVSRKHLNDLPNYTALLCRIQSPLPHFALVVFFRKISRQTTLYYGCSELVRKLICTIIISMRKLQNIVFTVKRIAHFLRKFAN